MFDLLRSWLRKQQPEPEIPQLKANYLITSHVFIPTQTQEGSPLAAALARHCFHPGCFEDIDAHYWEERI